MNLKPFYMLVSCLAVAAGAVWGWREAVRDPRFAARRAAREGAQAPAPKETEGGRPETASESRSRSGPREAPEAEPAPAPRATREPTTSERERLARIRRLIDEEEFAEAARLAARLRDGSRTSARERAERWRARAVLLERLVPESRDEKPVRAFLVHLANQNVLTAIEVVDEGDRYHLKLASGVVFEPLKEDVLEVEAADTRQFLQAQAKKLERRVAKLDDPIDLYLFGVRPCYRVGLREMGRELMERLFELPGGEQVPLMLPGEGSEDLVALWRIAARPEPSGEPGAAGARVPPAGSAGSTGLTGSTGSATSVASASPPAVSAGPRGRASTGGSHPRAGGSETSRPARDAPPPPAPSAGELRSKLQEVNRLLGEAAALYRSARGKDDREDDMRRSYRTLRKAQEILARLPSAESVHALNREVGLMIFDVSRALPFGG